MTRTHIITLILAVAIAGCSGSPDVADVADLVLTNGVIYTLDPNQPWAEAVAVKGDKILAVGPNAAVNRHVGFETRVIDLDGAFVTPGFNDGHVHVGSTGALLVGVNLLDVHEPSAFAERICAATGRLPAGSLISGGSWGAYEQWGVGSAGGAGSTEAAGMPDSAGAPDGPDQPETTQPFTPSRDLIDDCTQVHPVLVSRFDGSMHLANAVALELTGIDNSTSNPPDGGFDRDASGRLTGILRGAAFDRVRNAMPEKTHDQRMVEFEAVQDEARRGGVTTIQDLTSAEMLRVYQETRDRGNLTVRVMIRPTLFMVDHVRALGLSEGFGDDWLKLVGYKAWVDGIMGNSTALFFEPYDHLPGQSGSLRTIMFPEGEEGAGMSMTREQKYTDFPLGNLEVLLETALETGVPPHVHAIGDKGVRILLDIYEKLLTKHGLVEADHRWRMIHAQVVDSSDFHRFGDLNLVAEVNPYHISDDMRWMEERIGSERSRGAYAFRTLMDNGAVLVFGSDSPGTNAARYFLHPKYGLYAAVSRQTLTGEPAGGWFPDERLTIEEAIEAYTLNPAWATFDETRKGSLEAGKLADIAVFDTNLIEVGRTNPRLLLDAEVLYTVVGGRVVFSHQNQE